MVSPKPVIFRFFFGFGSARFGEKSGNFLGFRRCGFPKFLGNFGIFGVLERRGVLLSENSGILRVRWVKVTSRGTGLLVCGVGLRGYRVVFHIIGKFLGNG